MWKMKGKTKFLKMYYKLPIKARNELVYDFTKHPMTLGVLSVEVRMDTKMGKKILKKLGYEDD